MNDTERLDLIADNLLICHPPAPTENAFDGKWVICDYTLPDPVDFLSRDKDLRRAIDKIMKGEK